LNANDAEDAGLKLGGMDLMNGNRKKKQLTLREILHVIDFSAKVVCYINDEEDPVWSGWAHDIPYWLAELELNVSRDNDNEEEQAIDFRRSLGEEFNNEPGFVICLRED